MEMSEIDTEQLFLILMHPDKEAIIQRDKFISDVKTETLDDGTLVVKF